MKDNSFLATVIMFFSDIVMFNISFFIAYWLRMFSSVFNGGYVSIGEYVNLVVFSNIVMIVLFNVFGLYKEKRTLFDADEFIGIFAALFFSLVIVTSTTFLFKAVIYSRFILIVTFFIALVLVSLERVFISRLFGILRKRGHGRKKVLIYADKELSDVLVRKIKNRPELGYIIKGVCNSNAVRFEKLNLKKIDIVFLSAKDASKFIGHAMQSYIDLKIIPEVIDIVAEKPAFNELSDIPLMEIKSGNVSGAYIIIKSFFDHVLALFLILLLIPVFILVSILIYASSPGRVMYKQKRVGKDGRLFGLYKFRTMDCLRNGEVLKSEVKGLFKVKKDPRVFFFGRVLRRTCLDELPQLFNILKGEMSFVGPRPHLSEEMKELEGWQKMRFKVKPGLTGLWQISGRHDINFDKTIALDVYYVNNMSLLLDVKIVFKTIPAIVFSPRW